MEIFPMENNEEPTEQQVQINSIAKSLLEFIEALEYRFSTTNDVTMMENLHPLRVKLIEEIPHLQQ